MSLRVLCALIFVSSVIVNEVRASIRVSLAASATTTSDPRNVLDAPLRPRCHEGERYYKGICRKVYQINRKEQGRTDLQG
jgi:hypothetical protein